MSTIKNHETNQQLLSGRKQSSSSNQVSGIISMIGENRPLLTAMEAEALSFDLISLLALLEYSSSNEDMPANSELVTHGQGEVLRICRLASLRINRFLDTRTEEEQR